MSDMNFEDEFNDFFSGDSSLFKQLGEDKAKKVFELIKKRLKESQDINGDRLYILTNPFSQTVSEQDFANDTDNKEPSEIFEGWEGGFYILKKTWRDDEGRIVNIEITNLKPKGRVADVPSLVPMALLKPIGTKRRTLDELLEHVVEIEDYDTAALLRDIKLKDKEFQTKFWEEMVEASNSGDLEKIKKLVQLEEKNKESINSVIDEYDQYIRRNGEI